jgi:hypothetical protein
VAALEATYAVVTCTWIVALMLEQECKSECMYAGVAVCTSVRVKDAYALLICFV